MTPAKLLLSLATLSALSACTPNQPIVGGTTGATGTAPVTAAGKHRGPPARSRHRAPSPASVDWKMYGASQADWCFYDNAGIVHATLSSIRVWTKCVSKARMNEVNIEKDYNGLILKTASKKVTQGYVPPMMTVVHYDDDHFFNAKIDIINYEEVADIAAIEPASRVLYELDCLRGQIRELSLRATVNVHDKPPDWKPIAPETIASTLSRLICPTK